MLSPVQWLLLIILSVLWGGSFFFVGVAVKELPAFTIVLVRVVLAAILLVPFVLLAGHRLPTTAASWMPFLGMSVLNNVIPFSAIVLGQKEIASGLASVLNATTPLFALFATHLLTTDKLRGGQVAGVVIGVAGVALLMGPAAFGMDKTSLAGMLLILVGTASYGLASVWGRRLRQTPPLVSACCQLLCSSVVLSVLAASIDRPWNLPWPSTPTIAAMLGLAALSTSLAYVIFFRILSVAGAFAVMLVTLLIPISGIALGVIVLGEPLVARHILGAVVIGAGLLVIDGRLLAWARSQLRPSP
ncbi:MAG: DMT family transporter [Hyphomicrobiaceae bacterium]